MTRPSDLPPAYEVFYNGEFDSDFPTKSEAKAYRNRVLRDPNYGAPPHRVRIYKTFYKDVTPCD